MARTREDYDFMASVVSAAVGQKADLGDVNDGSGAKGFYVADKLVARLPEDAPLGQQSLVWEEGVEHRIVDDAEVQRARGWQPFQTTNTVAAREAAAENDAASEVGDVQSESPGDTAEGPVPDMAGPEAGTEPTEAGETPSAEPETDPGSGAETEEAVDTDKPKK